MRALLVSLALVVMPGCAGAKKLTAYQAAYAGGAISAKFIDESHTEYSTVFNAKLGECDPGQNPDSPVTTKTELDECMGEHYDYATHEKIGNFLKTYNAAAKKLSTLLLAGTGDEVAIRAAWADARDAALKLVALLPGADKLTNDLSAMLGGN